jgi:hypothetical protein
MCKRPNIAGVMVPFRIAVVWRANVADIQTTVGRSLAGMRVQVIRIEECFGSHSWYCEEI